MAGVYSLWEGYLPAGGRTWDPSQVLSVAELRLRPAPPAGDPPPSGVAAAWLRAVEAAASPPASAADCDALRSAGLYRAVRALLPQRPRQAETQPCAADSDCQPSFIRRRRRCYRGRTRRLQAWSPSRRGAALRRGAAPRRRGRRRAAAMGWWWRWGSAACLRCPSRRMTPRRTSLIRCAVVLAF